MGSIISSKNKQLLQGEQNLQPPCICTPGECPVDGNCTQKEVIYQATVETQNQEIFKYIGLTEKPFKERFIKHESSFRVHDPRNATSLSKKILELQRKHILFEVEWEILQKSKSYSAGAQECRLCINEIYHILTADNILNSRNEFFNKCRHKNKFKLSSK